MLCVSTELGVRFVVQLMSLSPVLSPILWSFLNYRKRGSALPILCVRCARWRERERERERDTETERQKEVTSPLSRQNWRWVYTFPCQKFAQCRKFAQLAMSSHFPLPKIRTFRFSLYTSRLSRSSLLLMVTVVALKFAMSSHFPLPKILASLFRLSQLAGAARRVIENQDKWSNPAQSLFFPLKKWIKLIPKTIGNRKRYCAWGGSGW